MNNFNTNRPQFEAASELPPNYRDRYAQQQFQQQNQQFQQNAQYGQFTQPNMMGNRSATEMLKDMAYAASRSNVGVGGVNWGRADNVFINSTNKILSGGMGEVQQDYEEVIKENASNTMISILKAIKSRSMSNRVYVGFSKGLEFFENRAIRDHNGRYQAIVNYDGTPVKSELNRTFLKVVNADRELRDKIEYNLSLLMGYNSGVYARQCAGKPNETQEYEKLLGSMLNLIPDMLRSVLNIYMYAWVSNTNHGASIYSKCDESEKQFVYAEAGNFNNQLQTVYSYFGFGDAYTLGEIFGTTSQSYADFSSMMGAKVADYNDNPIFSFPQNKMSDEKRQELEEYAERSIRHYRKRRAALENGGEYSNTQDLFVKPAVVVEPTRVIELTKENIDTTNMNKFFTPIGEGWYTINNLEWIHIKHFYTPIIKGDHESTFNDYTNPFVRVIKFDPNDRSIPYESRELNLETMEKKRLYLQNPKDLLPLIFKNEETSELDVVYELDLDEYMAKKEKSVGIDLEPIPEVKRNTLAFSNKPIYVSKQANIKNMLTGAYYKEFAKYKDDKIITLALPFRIYEEVHNATKGDYHAIKRDYEHLIIGNDIVPNNYFDYITYVKNQLELDTTLSPQIKDAVRERATEVIENWFIEERGYGTGSEPNSLNITDIFKANDGLKEYLFEHDEDSYLALANDVTIIEKLKKRMELFPDDEMLEHINKKEQVSAEMDNPLFGNVKYGGNLYIVKDIIFTMSNNVTVPEYTEGHKCIEKFSLNPTKVDIYKQIVEHYNGLMRDPEVMSIFENAKDELWGNRFSGFDPNVLVSRKVNQSSNLLNAKYL